MSFRPRWMVQQQAAPAC